MALLFDDFALAITFVTVLLELLNKAGRNLLLLNGVALAIALCTLNQVVGGVSTRATAVRADNLTVVGHFRLMAHVQLFQSHPDLQ